MKSITKQKIWTGFLAAIVFALFIPMVVFSNTIILNRGNTLDPTFDDVIVDDLAAGKSDGSDGGNITAYATLTDIHTFSEANWNEDDATWTMTGTGPLVHVAGNTTTITATNTEAIVVGTTYKVIITGTGGGGTATYTLGGVAGTTIAASGAIAITDWITSNSTNSLIITPASACTVSITNITIEKATDLTGDVTVEGDLYTKSQILAKKSSFLYPQYSFLSDSDTGIGNGNVSGELFFFTDSTANLRLAPPWIVIPATYVLAWGSSGTSSPDVFLYRRAANHLIQRNSTNQQTVSIANTYTDASNYEYQSFTGVQGSSFNWTANTLGTGGDNIDMVVTPAGTGSVKLQGTTKVTTGDFVIESSTGAIKKTGVGVLEIDSAASQRIDVRPGGSVAASFTASYNFGLGTTNGFGTSATKVFSIGLGTAPTTSPADVAQMWTADKAGVAGQASFHMRDEAGNSGPVAFAQVLVTTHSATEAATSATMYGDTHRVTGAYTITIPNVAVGMNSAFRATTAAVMTLDCDATDAFVLNGVALTAGNRIATTGAAGDTIWVEVTVDNQIDVYGNCAIVDVGS